jgi:hypothetical protein
MGDLEYLLKELSKYKSDKVVTIQDLKDMIKKAIKETQTLNLGSNKR